MALQEVDRIIDILKTAHQQKMVEQEGKRRQEEQESLAQNRLAVRDQADKAFQQHVKDQEAQQKIAQQAADLQMKVYKLHGAQALQQMGEEYQKTGVAPGGQAAPMATSATGGDFSPANPQQATGAQLTIPGMEDLGSIQVATPERAAARQADLTRITQRPKVEAQIEESRALQADMLNKQAEAKQADLDRVNVQKQYDDARAAKVQEAEMARLKLTLASHERIAKISRGASDMDLSPYAQQIIDGDLSRDDVLKLPIPKPDQMRLINAVTGAGAGILSKDQKELVGDFSQMVQAVKLMDQIIANQPQTHNKITSHIAGAFSSLDQNVTGPQEELNGHISLLARGFAKEKGNLSNKDIERVQKMLPDRYQPVETNIKKRDDYLIELDRTIDAKLASVPKAQRDMIKKKVGLLDIGLYNKEQPAQSQPAALGATHMWTPQGIQPVGAGK